MPVFRVATNIFSNLPTGEAGHYHIQDHECRLLGENITVAPIGLSAASTSLRISRSSSATRIFGKSEVCSFPLCSFAACFMYHLPVEHRSNIFMITRFFFARYFACRFLSIDSPCSCSDSIETKIIDRTPRANSRSIENTLSHLILNMARAQDESARTS